MVKMVNTQRSEKNRTGSKRNELAMRIMEPSTTLSDLRASESPELPHRRC
ncbi:hypothetical protein BVRB_008840 [Beta vulgaris subsp. vulgaris]|uniref:Uncharacterized protein n=1 Tax=Beta vulgaris subsp. vulgaris TaxID=3555 RepID=A0A0J8B6F5_BETVV|nr:hypothetical protein BVRB_008840 [Beta vulgaris subsp. vulgaris]